MGIRPMKLTQPLSILCLLSCAALLIAGTTLAQNAPAIAAPPTVAQTLGSLPESPAPVAPSTPVRTVATSESARDSSAASSVAVVTLDQALELARANEPGFRAAVAASRNAQLDRSIARSGLLPQVVYHNQFLYTEGARYAHAPSAAALAANAQAPSQQSFIASNAVHEYVSQGVVTETIGLGQWNSVAHASAAAAIASAELEIARRGLTATVVGLFYASTTAQEKVAVEQRALNEAKDFVAQAGQREEAREAAHSDVLKAQLTQQQRERDLNDAKLQAEKVRLDLGVLLFADPRSPYSVALPAAKPLEERAAFESAAKTSNPELRSALETLHERALDVTAARSGYLPSLSLSYLYGIDAPQFAVNGRASQSALASHFDDAPRNLGYGATATLDIPVFDWFATENKVRQARTQREVAKTALSSAQRTLVAQLEEFYNEAELASSQLASLQLSVDTARESLRLTRMRYTAGEASVLDVVDAQNTLAQAELAHSDGVVRTQLALANLQILTGTI